MLSANNEVSSTTFTIYPGAVILKSKAPWTQSNDREVLYCSVHFIGNVDARGPLRKGSTAGDERQGWASVEPCDGPHLAAPSHSQSHIQKSEGDGKKGKKEHKSFKI